METGNEILILICVFLLILLGFFIVFTAAEEMTKKNDTKTVMNVCTTLH
ncbi:MAG: hypothetical protein AMQ22_02021 [Candidatus Methanofastidiosum methylothiophilum]|uniref:Uncharacterized protein n=1 Tax=Candidatus Methanofastidiosum methylothiophilum TaxID=1705564 RepID=A0A150IQU2_9EURY|nr:MAG: hypothetical protein AMQ22_02021 [Candidatus Methanofastidiosum methylthiophilus]